MTKPSSDRKRSSFKYHKKDASLFRYAHLLLDADLEKPEIEATARALLKTMRERGYEFFDGDVEDPDCVTCLFFSLLSAAQLGSGKSGYAEWEH